MSGGIDAVMERTDEAARARSSRHASAQVFDRFKEPERFSFANPPRLVIVKESMMTPTFSDPHRDAPGVPRRDLASDTYYPSSPIEKHFVPPPSIYAVLQLMRFSLPISMHKC